ncbi:MAG: DinB family protein [Saprospiraceae bacterium]|nr:DinB family protein [Saprospiraceae bacterium]
MNTFELIKTYTDYNLWANTLMSVWLRSFKDEDFLRVVESSFNFVQKTVLHICDAQYVWYQRLNSMDLEAVPSKTFAGSKDDALALLTNLSEKMSDFVKQQDDSSIRQEITYRLNNGDEDTQQMIFMLHHCMNHSTYHRGQLITMGRQLGYENPPRTDFIQFVRERNLK